VGWQTKNNRYIEAKNPYKNLDDIEDTEQLTRYRETFPNLILTNFFDFRLFKNNVCVGKVTIADPKIIYDLKGVPYPQRETDLRRLLEEFFSFSFQLQHPSN
jgi:hypothetical protein